MVMVYGWLHAALLAQDAPPLERPTSLLTAPSGPESVLSRNRRRAAWSCYTGPAAFRSTRRVPARTVATHAALCTNKRAVRHTLWYWLHRNHTWLRSLEADTEAQAHRAALRCTPAHAPIPGPRKRPDDRGRGRGAHLSAAAESRRALPRVPAFRALGPACGILSSRPPSSPVCACTVMAAGRVAGGISFRLGHVDNEGADSCQPAAGHLRVDAHHHAAVASTHEKPSAHVSGIASANKMTTTTPLKSPLCLFQAGAQRPCRRTARCDATKGSRGLHWTVDQGRPSGRAVVPKAPELGRRSVRSDGTVPPLTNPVRPETCPSPPPWSGLRSNYNTHQLQARQWTTLFNIQQPLGTFVCACWPLISAPRPVRYTMPFMD